MGELQLSGQLDVHQPAGEHDGSAALAAAREAFAAASAAGMAQAWETVVAAARVGPLLLDLTAAGADQPWALTAVPTDGADWIPVFTGVEELARWRQRCGRGNETVHYAAVPGAQLPELLPAAPEQQPVGIVLDPASPAPLTLPAHELTSENEES